MTTTIFALATAPGRAAVAVLRLSGPSVGAALAALSGSIPAARRASLRTLRDAQGDTLDKALVLWMPGPASFTGEDCAELHLHGGEAVVSAVSTHLMTLGLQPAEPGAFTRRAFEAGKIDLIQAEGIADLVDAETEAQRRQAIQQADGSASQRYAEWRARLIAIMAKLEAAVDFPDEDIPEDVSQEARRQITALALELDDAVADRRGERVRDGFRIALLGAPNVGKSSLFNALLGRDAAIVTDIAGTTRDVIEADMLVAGRKVILADLAGLRESEDPIEAEGVRRARAWGRSADLRLRLGWPTERENEEADVAVWTMADVRPAPAGRLAVSATSGAGLDRLRAVIEERVVASTSGAGPAVITRERHRQELRDASTFLHRAAEGSEPELMAEEARLAARAIERFSGRIDAESVLDAVFSTFCIGK